MNKILGSLLLLISAPIFALTTATASINQSWFYPGDQIVLTLSASGNNVVFPAIDNIDGSPVLYMSNSQKISIVNNQRFKQNSKSYIFKPTKDSTIPAYTIIVDGDKQSTKPLELSLKKPSQSKLGDEYVLQIEIDKQTIFLGDKANLKITFKEKKSLPLGSQASIIMPEVKGLLFIKNSNSSQSSSEKYNIHTLNYQVSATDFGNFAIPSVTASISNRNSVFDRFSAMGRNKQVTKVYSNSLTFDVTPLPNALRAFGDFKIKASIDNSVVNHGQAVNLIVTIHGSGNFEDIEDFSLDIDGTTIYSDKAEFNYQQWRQKFAIVGSQDFTIPSFEFNYFDKITQSKKYIKTNPISIQIKAQKAVKKIDKEIVQNTTNISNNLPANNLKYYYLLLGIIIGTIVSFFAIFVKNKKQSGYKNITNQIKLARGDKALFDLLLPLNISSLDAILQQLEANIYKNAQYKIRKKDIINAIKFEHKTN